jgi:hypothetical protein
MPGQPLAVGVTVIVATRFALVVLVATKLGVLPVPEAASPIDMLSLVHVKLVPVVGLVKLLAAIDVPPQTGGKFDKALTVGFGFTEMVYVLATPGQPLAVGVTVIVATILAAVALVATKLGVFPVPEAPNPIAVLLFVHAKVAPVVKLVKLLAGIVNPLHSVIAAGATTVGSGFTVMV